MEILNSEGIILSTERIERNPYLKIKRNSNNQYSFIPITEQQLEEYFIGNLTLRDIIAIDDYAFVDVLYTNIQDNTKTNTTNTIITNL